MERTLAWESENLDSSPATASREASGQLAFLSPGFLCGRTHSSKGTGVSLCDVEPFEHCAGLRCVIRGLWDALLSWTWLWKQWDPNRRGSRRFCALPLKLALQGVAGIDSWDLIRVSTPCSGKSWSGQSWPFFRSSIPHSPAPASTSLKS